MTAWCRVNPAHATFSRTEEPLPSGTTVIPGDARDLDSASERNDLVAGPRCCDKFAHLRLTLPLRDPRRPLHSMTVPVARPKRSAARLSS